MATDSIVEAMSTIVKICFFLPNKICIILNIVFNKIIVLFAKNMHQSMVYPKCFLILSSLSTEKQAAE